MTRCFAELVGGPYDGDEVELPEDTAYMWPWTRSVILHANEPAPHLLYVSEKVRQLDETITYVRPERLMGKVRLEQRGMETIWIMTVICDIDEEVFFGVLE